VRSRPRVRDANAPGSWAKEHQLLARLRAEINARPSLGFARTMMRVAVRYYRYARLCGRTRAISYLLAEHRGTSGLVCVNDPVLGVPIRLRIGSTDINVAGKILLEREYDLPLSYDPLVIVDAGAYTGISSLWFAARYPNATIVSLEPATSNFQVLLLNVAHERRVIPLREALWPSDGTIYVTDNSYGAWAYRVSRHTGNTPVMATSIPTLMQRLGVDRIDLLKLDIEGAEHDLFQDGAQDWLTSVHAIAIETHDGFRTGSRAAVLRACVDFSATFVGNETLFLQRQG